MKYSIEKNIMDSFTKDIVSLKDKLMKHILVDCLKEEWNNETLSRITRIIQKNKPFIEDYYIDYGTQRQKFLCTFDNTPSLKFSEGSIIKVESIYLTVTSPYDISELKKK